MNNLKLAPRLQNLVDLGESGTDILHGELKNLMLEAEQEYLRWQKVEEDNDYDDAMDSMERKYYEGLLDAYSTVYQLTYELAFAISDRHKLTNPA
jgi:hypothetical protein